MEESDSLGCFFFLGFFSAEITAPLVNLENEAVKKKVEWVRGSAVEMNFNGVGANVKMLGIFIAFYG